MGKIVKKIGTAIGIVGLIATGIGAGAVGGLLGISAKVASVATKVALGLGAALSTIGGALQKGPKLEDFAANALGQSFFDPNAHGVFVFSTTAVPMAAIYEEQHGTDPKLLTTIFAHAWHEIDSYGSLWVDGELVSFSGDNATGDYAGILTWRRKTGTLSQTHISIAGSAWPSTADGKGFAHSALTWDFVDKDKLTGGIPRKVTMQVAGAKLYDPRLDSTVGGSGAHRYDDPSTFEFENGNAALVALRYIIGEYSSGGDLIWGVGAPASEVDIASFIAAANIADEIVDTNPQFRIGGFMPTTNAHAQFVEQWEASTGGKIARLNGVIFCWLPDDDLTPAATITDADIRADGGVVMEVGGDVRTLFNTARGRYIDPSENYQAALYPEIVETTYVSDDGGPRILALDLPWIQSGGRSQRIARYAIRRSRFARRWIVEMGWRALQWAPFTVLTLNCQETDDQDVLVRVARKTISIDGRHVLELQEEDASIYDTSDALLPAVGTNTIPKQIDHAGTAPASSIDNQGALATADTIDMTDETVVLNRGDLAIADTADLSKSTSGGVINRTAPNIAETGDLWWAHEDFADRTLTNTAAAISGQGTLATRNDATWSGMVSGRPVELTDGRISTALNSSGRLSESRFTPGTLGGGIRSTMNKTPVTGWTDTGSAARIDLTNPRLWVGGHMVDYPAGSVSALNYNTDYWVYRDDIDLTGAGTYKANPLLVNMAIQDGRIVMGNFITGSSGGGGGGAGGGGAICVGVDMSLDHGVLAREAKALSPIDLLTERLDGVERGRIDSVEFGAADCVEIETAGGARLVCSKTTPLTLEDGEIINVTEGLGRNVPVDYEGAFAFDRIIHIAACGIRDVAHIHVGGRTYAAGERPEKRIFTHNAVK